MKNSLILRRPRSFSRSLSLPSLSQNSLILRRPSSFAVPFDSRTTSDVFSKGTANDLGRLRIRLCEELIPSSFLKIRPSPTSNVFEVSKPPRGGLIEDLRQYTPLVFKTLHKHFLSFAWTFHCTKKN